MLPPSGHYGAVLLLCILASACIHWPRNFASDDLHKCALQKKPDVSIDPIRTTLIKSSCPRDNDLYL